MLRTPKKNVANALNIPLVLVALFAIANFTYWIFYSVNAYNTFHYYGDLGGFVYAMYYHVHYPGIVSGLQYLVFGNHIAPDLLLVLPFYALFQSPMALLLVQAAVMSSTGVILFLVADDLLKDRGIALLLAFVYFLNPGVNGMLIFDFHTEFLLLPFYLLTFYFYTKKAMGPMVLSLMLLLGSHEDAAFLGLSLGFGLILYNLLHNRDKQSRRKNVHLASIIMVLSLAVLLAYIAISAYLSINYAHSYQGMPPILRVFNFDFTQLYDLAGVIGHTQQFVNASYFTNNTYLIVTGLLIVFLGFGFASLLDPILTVVLISPWLIEAFVLGNYMFIAPWLHYFSFALCGVMVATLLSLQRHLNHKKQSFFRSVYISATLILALFLSLFAASPLVITAPVTGTFVQSFLFQTNAVQKSYYSDLNYVISKIPQNASLMAPQFTMPHLYARRYFESIPWDNVTAYPDSIWFTPQYLLVDFNKNISADAYTDSQYQNFLYLKSGGKYQLYAKNGTAELYKLS
jgi:uncharacterized membrane protein